MTRHISRLIETASKATDPDLPRVIAAVHKIRKTKLRHPTSIYLENWEEFSMDVPGPDISPARARAIVKKHVGEIEAATKTKIQLLAPVSVRGSGSHNYFGRQSGRVAHYYPSQIKITRLVALPSDPAAVPGYAAFRASEDAGKLKLIPNRPSDNDLEAAIDHADTMDNKGWTIGDFDLAYLGELDVKDLSAYDDLSSWLELMPAASPEEANEELVGFRGKEWAERAQAWLQSGIPPIVVIDTPIIDEGGGTMVGDGRGRVNFASLMRKKIPVWKMTLRDREPNPASPPDPDAYSFGGFRGCVAIVPTKTSGKYGGVYVGESPEEARWSAVCEGQPRIIPRLHDGNFARETAGDPVLVVFSAPTKCPKCPYQMPAVEEADRRGIPVFHVDVEQADAARTSASRPWRLGMVKNPDGTKTQKMIPDHAVPVSYVYANGRAMARLSGLHPEVEDLEDFYEHGVRIAGLGMLGQSFWP